MKITAADNPGFRRLLRLAESARAVRASGCTIAEGVHLIESALDARIRIATLVTRGTPLAAHGPLIERVQRSAVASGADPARLVELAAPLYDRIAPVEHGAGIFAEIEIPGATPSIAAADAVFLDGVQDPGNAGTILRTAAAAGVGRVIAGAGTAFPWSPKVMRAAMGAHFRLQIDDAATLEATAGGFAGEVLAADVEGEDLFRADWGDRPVLWLFGAEGQGLSAAALRIAHRRLCIPLAAGVESLNVGAAAAVCLFEQVRRRRASSAPRCS
jgi:RNA methyltransferase, TrmH family